MRKFAFLILPILFVATVGFTGEDEKTDMNKFLEAAIMTGLTNEQFPRPVVKEFLGDRTYWVSKCPICRPVESAMKNYMSAAPIDSISGETPRGVMEEFESMEESTMEEKKRILLDLVDRYVQDHFKRLEFTEEERTAMEEKLMNGRKKGMSLASGGEGFFCAACDGACHKPD